jgi:gas vesicle protein
LWQPVKVLVIPVTKGDAMDDDYKKIAAAFLVGGAVGALFALLYAPKSGRETRKDIARTARKIKKETVHLVEDTIDSVNDFTVDMKDKVSELIDQGVELSSGAKKEVIRNLDHGQKVIEKQKKRIIEALGL